MQEKARKIKTIMAFGELHNRQLSESALGLYILALEQFSADEVEKAAGRIIARCKFFPQPAEFIEEITGGSDKKKLEAEKALEEALRQVRLVGCYRTPSLEPLCASVIANRFGGWSKFCMTDMNAFARKDFIEEYQIQSSRGLVDHRPLCGLLEGRQQSGLELSRIGDIIGENR